jgi:hypothetical protein
MLFLYALGKTPPKKKASDNEVSEGVAWSQKEAEPLADVSFMSTKSDSNDPPNCTMGVSPLEIKVTIFRLP